MYCLKQKCMCKGSKCCEARIESSIFPETLPDLLKFLSDFKASAYILNFVSSIKEEVFTQFSAMRKLLRNFGISKKHFEAVSNCFGLLGLCEIPFGQKS